MVKLGIEEQRIEKSIELRAPVSRAWRALTDPEEFGEWFQVKLSGSFVVGKTTHGRITYPGYEHLQWAVLVKEIVPEKYFSFTWHAYAVDPTADYSQEPSTLVEFRLEKTTEGTMLFVTESGFEKISSHRRAEAFLRNEGGWAEQMKNIQAYVDQGAHPVRP